MILSDISVKRPVFATVISLLLITIGVMCFLRLPLREYPDINPPLITVETEYRGASAAVVETKVTQVIEDRIAGIEGIKTIESGSRDGRSTIGIEFNLTRDIDAAANDVRDRVSRVLEELPEEADPPEVFKSDSNESVVMWLNLQSDTLDPMELTDYAERYLVDQMSVVDGVSRIRIGGGRRYAMRVWLNREALAARELTVADVEEALRRENVELPAGRIESFQREFTVRTERVYATADDFRKLVLRQGEGGFLVRLGDVARVEVGPEDEKRELRGNGQDMIGLGVVAQSTANVLAVAQGVQKVADRLSKNLPEGVQLIQSFNTAVFVEAAINEVYRTLGIAMLLVLLVIFLFLGNIRSALIPAVTVPVSLVGAFIALYVFDYSINLLTLLALVLAIGLVVDDAIVVLENIHRRIELGEPPLLAAFRGARQVAFAVIATTLVLVSVFAPIGLFSGNVGRLFSEFALALCAAVIFSSVVALTLSPMMCANLLKEGGHESPLSDVIDRIFSRLANGYRSALTTCLRFGWVVVLVVLGCIGGSAWLFSITPREFVPKEDRWAFFIIINGPEGATFEYTQRHIRQIEKLLMPYVESGDVTRALSLIPRFGQSRDAVNTGIALGVMAPDATNRKTTAQIIGEIAPKLAQIPGVRAFPVMRQGLAGRGVNKDIQFVLQGSTYEELAEWRDTVMAKAAENPGLTGVDSDYKETKPQFGVTVNRDRAADLGVSLQTVGRTLETMLGSRDVTTYLDRGEEYDVILQGKDDDRRSMGDLKNIYVRSDRTNQLIPLSNLVELSEFAAPSELSRFERLRAITIEANLAPNYTISEALEFLNEVVRQELPAGVSIGYKGQSREFIDSGGSLVSIFVLALLVVYLVLAAQFESFIHPFVIIITVPLAIAGSLAGLIVAGSSINIYSQVGLIMLIGLATKNGILIVEFANQLRDHEGSDLTKATIEASVIRLRPIIMTALSTVIGAVPLILASGAGYEARYTIGIVIFSGVLFASVLTLFVIPVLYHILGRFTQPPGTIERRLAKLESATPVVD